MWEADEARPTLAVTTTFAAPLVLRLRAVLGGTVVDWTQETWVDAATSSGTPIAVPDALLNHPEADGMPITVFGVADTGYQADWQRMMYQLYKEDGLSPEKLSDLYVNICPREWRHNDGDCSDGLDLPLSRWELSAVEHGIIDDVSGRLDRVEH